MNEKTFQNNQASLCPHEASVYVWQVFKNKMKQLALAIPFLIFLPWSEPLLLCPIPVPAHAFGECMFLGYSYIFILNIYIK